MSYDSWKTTEPDPYEWEECCPECKRLVTQCTCERSDDEDPMLPYAVANFRDEDE